MENSVKHRCKTLGEMYNMTVQDAGRGNVYVFPPVLMVTSGTPEPVIGFFICRDSLLIAVKIFSVTGYYTGDADVTCKKLITPDTETIKKPEYIKNVNSAFMRFSAMLSELNDTGAESSYIYMYSRYLTMLAEAPGCVFDSFLRVMAAAYPNFISDEKMLGQIFRVEDAGRAAEIMRKYTGALQFLGNSRADDTPLKPDIAERAVKPEISANAVSGVNNNAPAISERAPEAYRSDPEKRPEMRTSLRNPKRDDIFGRNKVKNEDNDMDTDNNREIKSNKDANAADKPCEKNSEASRPVKQDTAVSALEKAVPELKAYNVGIARFKGLGLFHAIAFMGGRQFFRNCVAKETALLQKAGVICSGEIYEGGKFMNGCSCIMTEGDDINGALKAGAYVFFNDEVPKQAENRVNCFDISGAGFVAIEEWFDRIGFRIGCDLAAVIGKHHGWDSIPEEVFVNNTMMRHFMANPDSLEIQENDLDWIQSCLAQRFTKKPVQQETKPEPSAEKPNKPAAALVQPAMQKPAAEASGNSPAQHTPPQTTTSVQAQPKVPPKAPVGPTVVKPAAVKTPPQSQKPSVQVKPPVPPVESVQAKQDNKTETVQAGNEAVQPQPSVKRPPSQARTLVDKDNNVKPVKPVEPKAPEPVKAQEQMPAVTVKEDKKDTSEPAPENSTAAPVPPAATELSDIGSTEDRKANLEIADAIIKENTSIWRTIEAARITMYDPLMLAYKKAVEERDIEFLGANYASQIWPDQDNELYTTRLYKKVFDSQTKVKDMLAKIRPVRKRMTCFFCRNKFEADISLIPLDGGSVTCPECGHSLAVGSDL